MAEAERRNDRAREGGAARRSGGPNVTSSTSTPRSGSYRRSNAQARRGRDARAGGAQNVTSSAFAAQGGSYRRVTTDEQARANYSPEEYQKRYRRTLDDKPLPKDAKPQRGTAVPATYDTDRSRRALLNQRTRAETYRNRARTKAKVRSAKRKPLAISLVAKSIIFGVNTAFWLPQLIFGLLFLIAFGLLLAGESMIFIRAAIYAVETASAVVDYFFRTGTVSTAGILWISFFLSLLLGWVKLAVIGFILKFLGTKPLYGTKSDIKIPLFLCAFIFYAWPVSNLFPWSMFWSWYVLRHPE